MVDKAEIQDFFSLVGGIVRSARQANLAIARAAAPRFCPISLLSPKEGDLSRIIAFLLDPAEAHGQRTTFLRLFLDLAGLPESNDDGDCVRVWREDVLSTGEGRADIRVDYTCRDGHRMHLLIENKPWANDGDVQIERYATYMANRYDSYWMIVYVPPTERDPGPQAIKPERLRALVERQQFIAIPYMAMQDKASIRRWLQGCEGQCEAEPPRRFIRDFLKYLKQNVPTTGAIQMDESERSASQLIVRFLRERDEDIDTALEIEMAIKELRAALAKDIAQYITNSVRQRLLGDWQITAEFSSAQFSGLTFRRPNWPVGRNARGEDCTCWVGFEFQSWDWKRAKLGVSAHRDIVAEDVRSRIAEHVRKEFADLWSQDEWWAAAHRNLGGDIPSDWLSNEFLNFARRVKRGEQETCDAVEKFGSTLIRVGMIVDSALANTCHEPA